MFYFLNKICAMFLLFYLQFFSLSIRAEEMARLLTRMCLGSEVMEDGEHIRVEIPPTRHDILLKTYYRSTFIIYSSMCCGLTQFRAASSHYGFPNPYDSDI